jgi:hypothetical protein
MITVPVNTPAPPKRGKEVMTVERDESGQIVRLIKSEVDDDE